MGLDDFLKLVMPVVFTVVFGIISYLLTKADKARESEIKAMRDANVEQMAALKDHCDSQIEVLKQMLEKQRDVNTLLFKKHDDDAAALSELRLTIAKEHYLKHELDGRFQSLETTFKEGMRGLSEEVKNLTQIMLAHLEKERGK